MRSSISGGSSQQVSSQGFYDGGCTPTSSSKRQRWPDETNLPCQEDLSP